jgi:putative molybdopterin biosynthesis protein
MTPAEPDPITAPITGEGDYLNLREVAALLRLGERKVYDLVREGRIPCVKVTGKWLFPRTKIETWLASSERAERTEPRPTPSLMAACPMIVAGSRDPLLEWCIAQSAAALAVAGGGSLTGLDRLAERSAAAAAVHVLDRETGDYNIPEVRRRLAQANIVVMEWARREQGLVVAPGNPLGLGGAADLAQPGIRTALRPPEAGAHVLLRHLLHQAGHTWDDLIAAGVFHSGLDVGLAVLDGRADAGLAVRAVARQLKLDFVPLAWERFDLVIDRRAFFEPPFQQLLNFARGAEARTKAADLQGYDLSGHGTVHWNAP